MEVTRIGWDETLQNNIRAPNITLQLLGADILQGKKSIRDFPYPVSRVKLDSAGPNTVLPSGFCSSLLEKGLGLQLDDSSGLYLIDTATHQKLLKQNPTFRFNVTTSNSYYWSSAYTTSVNFDFSYQEILLNVTAPLVASNMYYIPIQCSINSDDWVLGRAFMQKAYLIVTDNSYFLAKANLDPNAVPNPVPVGTNGTITIAPTSQHKTLSKGLIAGIVVACVVGAVLAVLGIWLIVKNRKRNSALKMKDQNLAGNS
jgi:hypothetical protein